MILKANKKFLPFFLGILFYSSTFAQVGIGTPTVSSGAILDITSSSKGVLFPRVALSTTKVQAPITGTVIPGTLVYNTVSSGSGTNAVTPGFYFWDGGTWRRMSVDGYSLHFDQTGIVVGNGSTFTTITGLDQTITAPFTGLYQIVVVAVYNARFPGTGGTGNVDTAIASVKLEQNGSKIAESMVPSLSPSALQALPQSVTIVRNVQLTAGIPYTFRVRGREWSVSAGYGFGGEFGTNSAFYDGAPLDPDGTQTDALRGSMTITLIKTD